MTNLELAQKFLSGINEQYYFEINVVGKSQIYIGNKHVTACGKTLTETTADQLIKLINQKSYIFSVSGERYHEIAEDYLIKNKTKLMKMKTDKLKKWILNHSISISQTEGITDFHIDEDEDYEFETNLFDILERL